MKTFLVFLLESPISAIQGHMMRVSSIYSGEPQFLLPDGTLFHHSYSTHEAAAIAAGTTLNDILRSGIIRLGFVSGSLYGIAVGGRMTDIQAHTVTDGAARNNRITVDVLLRGSNYITKTFTNLQPDAIRAWVNSQF